MIVIDRKTGRPVELLPAPQPQSLSAGQVVAGILVGIGVAAFTDYVVGSGFNRPNTKRRSARPSVVVEEDDLSDLEWVFYRTGGECFYCGKKLCISNRGYYAGRGAWEADHFVPFSRGGADQPYNFVAACVGCNRAKSDLLPWQFDEGVRPGDRNPQNYI